VAIVALSTTLAAAGADTFPGLPNSALTPGATNPAVTQKTIKSTICVSGWTSTIRPSSSYTTALKVKQLANGYSVNGVTNKSAYEEDHLVPLAVGGAPKAVENLWPEPWDGTRGARVKDKLENRVHSLICKGQMSLVEGQTIFMSDWTIGYEHLIGPLPAIAAASPVTTSTTSTIYSTTSTTTTSTTMTVAPTTTSGSNSSYVTPGAFCAPAGATGYSSKGVFYTCKTSATDTRNRWRQ
jgi:hypothetical protein